MLTQNRRICAVLFAFAGEVRRVSFKERYYFDKLGVSTGMGIAEDDAVLRQLLQSYVEALQWVMLYYYRG